MAMIKHDKISKPEKLAKILYQAIRRYSEAKNARKEEKICGLAVDSSRRKSVTVTSKFDQMENKYGSK